MLCICLDTNRLNCNSFALVCIKPSKWSTIKYNYNIILVPQHKKPQIIKKLPYTPTVCQCSASKQKCLIPFASQMTIFINRWKKFVIIIIIKVWPYAPRGVTRHKLTKTNNKSCLFHWLHTWVTFSTGLSLT